MDNDDFAPCWNCNKMNKKQPCGYYMCDCKSYKQSSVLWYMPMKVYNWRKGRLDSYKA